MENRYYTPTIEEFHVGFEYEAIAPGLTYGKQIYEGQSLNDYEGEGQGSIEDDIEDGEIRVKYLDKEDIESLGWTYDKEHEFVTFYTQDGYRLAQNKNGNRIIIELYVLDKDGSTESLHRLGTLFNGHIKNKSELKVLLKQLGWDLEQK